MDETAEPWDKSVPLDLIPAIKHLRKSFDDAHWGCGETTRIFCYSLLHNEIVNDPAKEHFNFIRYMKARVGLAAARRFNDLVREATAPAIFKAFYDLYLENMSVQALLIFREFTEIGRANDKRLGSPYLEWAEAQTKHMVRSHTHLIEIWVRNVCDKQVYDPNDDDEELIFWRKWRAPMLVVMKPSRQRPYDAATTWERKDAKASAQWLKSFANDYVLRLEMKLREKAGEAALHLAKQPKPVQPTELENVSRDNTVPTKGGRNTTKNARREVRKLETQARYASWNRAYRRLIKRRPDASDVWCSEKIAGMKIAEGSRAETIRKHMKK
jgi:hypothetical protein